MPYGRAPLPDEARRTKQVSTYLTESEKQALLAIGPPSDVLRQGLALIVSTKHPELLHALRSDLTDDSADTILDPGGHL
jgi:hypothetical protein